MIGWKKWNVGPDGRGMISASAGTGKTFTIAVLFIRLILERKLLPDQIVVTTFTNAAVAELSERLRGRIHDALTAARSGLDIASDNKDPLMSWLRDRWTDADLKEQDRKQLLAAWSAMDRAPILTLHGFCSKLIGEYPLLLNAPLEPTPLLSEGTVVEDIADDIWRRHTQAGSSGSFSEIFEKRGSLRNQLKVVLKPELQLGDLSDDAFPQWLAGEDGSAAITFLQDVLETKKSWFKGQTNIRRKLPGFIDWLIATRDGGTCEYKLNSADFMPRKWRAAAVAGHENDVAALDYSLMKVLGERIARVENLPKFRIFQEARDLHDQYLVSRNVTTFGQMIYRVFEVLERGDATARELADSVFARYPVVLIDESQDTDQVQYAIMDRIYRDAEGKPRGRMIMIGDVKQAIYGFRGGDVECFQLAQKEANELLTLSTNFRSSPEMLDGFNSFYQLFGDVMSSSDPDDDSIKYEPFNKPDNDGPGIYRIDGERVADAMNIHVDDATSIDEAVNTDKLNEAVLQACANQIADMLQSERHTIQPDGQEERPIEPGDFAVIMRRNVDVIAMRRMLNARGVPAVTQLKQSVLASPWLLDLASVVVSAAVPFDEGKASAAKLARFFKVEDQPDPHVWAAHLENAGIMGLALELMRAHGAQLMARKDGERAMTDIRHLAEIMQDHYAQTGDAQETVHWIFRERDEGNDDPDAPNALRMESDAKRVQVVTAHASKGLEYNIVMLPTLYVWGSAKPKSSLRTVKGTDGIHTQLAESADAKAKLLASDADENHRLQYVALTRAKYACHVYFLEETGKSGSPMIDRWNESESKVVRPGLKIHEGLPQPHDTIVKWSGAVSTDAALREEALPLPEIRAPHYQHSFSTMTRSHHEQVARGGEDESDVEVTDDASVPHPLLLKLRNVKGKQFGVAIHEAMEDLLSGDEALDLPKVVESALTKNGVKHDATILADTVELIARTFNATIRLNDGSTLKLSDLKPYQIQRELNFRFHLENTTVKELQQIVANHGERDLFRGVTMRELSGLLKGSIDLLFEHGGKFHVLDYKGNYLGDSIADYEEPNLTERVEQQNYDLQAFIYSLAVDRMVRARWKGDSANRHGGAVYLFMRALGLSETAGIWTRHFDPDLLHAVNEMLAFKGEVE